MTKDDDFIDMPDDDLDSIPDDGPLDDTFDDSDLDSIPNDMTDDTFNDDADSDKSANQNSDNHFDNEDDYDSDDDWENGEIDSEFAEAESNELKADTIELDEYGNYVELLPHLLDVIPYEDDEAGTIHRRVDLFHESVIETLIENWQSCQQMCCDLLPDFPYVGLFFDSNQVGGFSFKDRRNEAKGSIIECINSGRITTMITPGLLAHKAFVFVPNAATLSAMDEFELLTESIYKLCFCDEDGNVQLSDLTVSYNAIARMILADVNIRESIIYELTEGDSLKDSIDFEDDFGDSEEITE